MGTWRRSSQGASGKESTCQGRSCRKHGFRPWMGQIPWGREWQSTPVFFPGKSHGQRSRVGCSPWGHTELDTTKWLTTHAWEHTMLLAFYFCLTLKEGARLTWTYNGLYLLTDGFLGRWNILAALILFIHILCAYVELYQRRNFPIVELLGHQVQAFYVLIGIAKLLFRKFIPIYKTPAVYEKVCFSTFFPLFIIVRWKKRNFVIFEAYISLATCEN